MNEPHARRDHAAVPPTKPVRVGILSDTHLSGMSAEFQRRVDACFADAAIILHAGDLTSLDMLAAFGSRRVHAVHGNMCGLATMKALPSTKTITIGRFAIGLTHHAGGPSSYDFEHQLIDLFDPVDCIVYGHTHRPVCHRTGGILYINPGAFSTSSRFGPRGTYAILDVSDDGLSARIHEVPDLP